MDVAIGLKTHSGWAVLIALGNQAGHLHLVERCIIHLVDELWAKQPYHAAEKLPPHEAADLVQRGIAAAHSVANRELSATRNRLARAGHQATACAVLVGEPMPDWTVHDILSVHMRMHKAEGVLFQNVLLRAAEACGLKAVPVREKDLPVETLTAKVAPLGKTFGPPWGKDQRNAAMAAIIALGK